MNKMKKEEFERSLREKKLKIKSQARGGGGTGGKERRLKRTKNGMVELGSYRNRDMAWKKKDEKRFENCPHPKPQEKEKGRGEGKK